MYNALNRQTTKPEFYTIVLVCILWGSRLMSLITSASLRVLGGSQLAYLVVPAIEILVVFLGWSFISRKVRIGDALFFLLSVLAFLSSYIFFPANEKFLDEYVGGYITCCSMLFLGILVNIEKMEKPMYIISIITIFFQFYYSLFYNQAKIGTFDEAGVEDFSGMYYAYITLPHVLFAFYYLLKLFTIPRLLVALAGTFLLILYGSRGPVLCVVLYVAIYIVLINKAKHKWVLYLVLTFIVGIFLLYMDIILQSLQMIISSLGMRTKIVDMMLEDTLYDDSGREALLDALRQYIRSDGGRAYGFCGSWPIIDTYPHNLYYDFLVTFGVVLGNILFFALVVLLIKGFLSCPTDKEKGVWLVFFITGFIHLFLSGTFISTSSFFMMIGYSIRLIRNGKRPLSMQQLSIQGRQYAQ